MANEISSYYHAVAVIFYCQPEYIYRSLLIPYGITVFSLETMLIDVVLSLSFSLLLLSCILTVLFLLHSTVIHKYICKFSYV